MAKKLTEKSTKVAAEPKPASKTKSKPAAPKETTLERKSSKNKKHAAEEDVQQAEPKAKKTKIVDAVSDPSPVKETKRKGSISKAPAAVPETKAKKSAVAPAKQKEAAPEEDEEEWGGFGAAEEAVVAVVEKVVKKKPETSKKPSSISRTRNPEPAPESDAEEEVEEEETYLHGFSSDDQDSSDEDDMVDDAPALDVQKLPTIAKDDKSVKQRLDKAKRLPTEDKGVIYLGRVPHGFYEDQMKAYFTQFGDVTRLRLSRSKRTGRSKHYAFIEFDSSRVAEIVAETMDNYLLMGHILRCKVVPKSEVHPQLWIGANKKFKVLPKAILEQKAHNKPRTQGEQGKASERLVRRQQLKKRKLEEMGIEYDFDTVGYKKKPKSVEV